MKKTIILLLLISSQIISAQKYEMGKVTKEELEQTTHPTDTSAVAAILFHKGRSFFEYHQEKGFILITEVETKIKIYKKEGLDWANKEVAIYIGESEKENVEFSKAYTYNIENSKIEKTKLKREGEFDEITNKYWAKKKIVMPNVREGSIIEYKYVLRSPFYSTFPDWYFQNSIPVDYSEYKTQIPEYFYYNAHKTGWIFPNEVKSKQGNKIILTSSERNTSAYINYKTTFNRDEINYIENHVTYILENIPAIKEESYVNNISNYAVKVQHELSQTRFPNSHLKSFSTTWEDVAKNIYDSENFGSELKKSGYFEDEINKLLLNITSKEEQIKAIYQFVKNKVKWDNYNGIYCDKGVKKAYNDRSGNVAEINLMLTAMLRHAGFEANPVLVSTRSNGISIFPSRTGYNYVITAVELDHKIHLLDATSKFSTQNILPLRAINWMGRLIKKDGTSITIDLLSKDMSTENTTIMSKIDEVGNITGKTREQKFRYNAYLYRENNNDLSIEQYQEKLEKKRKGIEIDELSITNKNDIDQPIVETYSFASNRFVDLIGDRMYFSPMLFFEQLENPFKLDKRIYPIEFDFPFKDNYNITITIPDGYIIETLPENLNLVINKEYGAFKFIISNVSNTIQLLCSLEMKTAIIPNQDYETLKLFFKEIVTKQSEKVVLKKI
ncbi:MAG: DUF3857 domain-containing protein [Flavobacteriaceae bacterium]|nr:DUF3857 domain-containing protein [Flavobacteriaceae bacterium]